MLYTFIQARRDDSIYGKIFLQMKKKNIPDKPSHWENGVFIHSKVVLTDTSVMWDPNLTAYAQRVVLNKISWCSVCLKSQTC